MDNTDKTKDSINLETAKNVIRHFRNKNEAHGDEITYEDLDLINTILDTLPREKSECLHAHWIWQPENNWWICSNCENFNLNLPDLNIKLFLDYPQPGRMYCPTCGAIMYPSVDGEKNEVSIRNHEAFDGCRDLMTICNERLNSEIMSKEVRNKAQERFHKEWSIIESKGYIHELFILSSLCDYAISHTDLIIVQGRVSYLYTAYLLGITMVNPLAEDYPMEIAWGPEADSFPEIIITASEEFIYGAKNNLVFMFQSDNVSINDNVVYVGAPEDKNSIRIEFRLDANIAKAEILMRKRKDTRDKVLRYDGASWLYADDDLKNRIRNAVGYHMYETNYERNLDNCCLKFLDGTYGSVISALALIYGEAVAKADFKDEESNSIYTLDDLYRYGEKIFNDTYDAYTFMNLVSNGFGNSEEIRNMLSNANCSSGNIDRLKLVKHMEAKGDLVPFANLFMYLAVNLPSAFTSIEITKNPMVYEDTKNRLRVKVIAMINHSDGPYFIGINYDNDTDAYMLKLESKEFYEELVSVDYFVSGTKNLDLEEIRPLFGRHFVKHSFYFRNPLEGMIVSRF